MAEDAKRIEGAEKMALEAYNMDYIPKDSAWGINKVSPYSFLCLSKFHEDSNFCQDALNIEGHKLDSRRGSNKEEAFLCNPLEFYKLNLQGEFRAYFYTLNRL